VRLERCESFSCRLWRVVWVFKATERKETADRAWWVEMRIRIRNEHEKRKLDIRSVFPEYVQRPW